MARTIKLKETDLTKIVRRISETRLLMEEPKEGDRRIKKGLKAWSTIISTIGSLWPSDSRLKKNIRRVGKSPSGIPIYEFEYKNKTRFGKGTFRGVLAEQAPRRAVVVASNGYKMVDYGMLDVDFERVNPRKTRLSERDLSRVIGRVINERRWEMPDLTKGTVYYPDMDLDGWMGGQSQGGGSDDPMATGNEERDFDLGTTGPTNPNARQAGELMKNLDYRGMKSAIQGHRTMGRAQQSELMGIVGKMEQMSSIIGTVPDDDPQIQAFWKWLGGVIGKFRDWLDDLLHDCYCGGSWGPCPC